MRHPRSRIPRTPGRIAAAFFETHEAVIGGRSVMRAGMKLVQGSLLVVLAATVAAPTTLFAQSHPEFIALGRVSAALYKPDRGPAPHVAFVVGHRTANYLNHI